MSLAHQADQGIYYKIPKLSFDFKGINNFTDELYGFQSVFQDCFVRSEPRKNFYRYLSGLMSNLERKSVGALALETGEGRIRSLQRFISDAPWDDEEMLRRYHHLLTEEIGAANGVVVIGEHGFPKKGVASVGVLKQYCGPIERIENCQVGVFAGYATQAGYALLDDRLFMPEEWFDDSHIESRRKCKVPENLTFRTKSQLASDMIARLVGNRIVEFKYVMANSRQWEVRNLVEAVERRPGMYYFFEVPSTLQCKPLQGGLQETECHFSGFLARPASNARRRHETIAVEALGRKIKSYFWYQWKVFEGQKGFVLYDFATRPVLLYHDGQPFRELWLVVKRSRLDEFSSHYFVTNTPPGFRLSTCAWLSGVDWSLDQCLLEARTKLGMDHYELRKHTGWNHHMLACMLAHFFLWHINVKFGLSSSKHYSIKTPDILHVQK